MKPAVPLLFAVCLFASSIRADQLGVPAPDSTIPRPESVTPPQEPSLPPQRPETRPSGPVVTPPRSAPEQAPSATEPRDTGKPTCGYRMIEQTIYVPAPVHETRTVQCVEYTTEARQQTVTVMHAVPEKQTITRDCVVMVPEKRTRTENYTVCKKVPSGDCCGSCKVVEE